MSLSAEITKDFGGFVLDVKLEAGNEVLALLGASGSGKSLTLQTIAGIFTPDKGRIILDGRTLFDSRERINLPTQKRHCGLMFQSYALFPNMTAEQNLLAPVHSLPKPERSSLAASMLELFGLSEVRKHYPSQLSGGQRQRTALARMLLAKPGIIMLDEPFSALDQHIRQDTEGYLLEVFRNFGGTVILVSHDSGEVFRLADRVAVINDGRIEACGTKHEIFTSPPTRTAAILTGCRNISRAERSETNEIFASDWGITLRLPLREGVKFVGVRSRDIRPSSDCEGQNVFRCTVAGVVEDTASFTVTLRPEGTCGSLCMDIPKDQWAVISSDSMNIYLPEKSILQLKE
ncbi:MAG: ATP-binding cassette domain-containing protein [Synergistaceae bacterium]|nr:ATP-binding cassette domain-containing protein [Synergistaceae bacterium]